MLIKNLMIMMMMKQDLTFHAEDNLPEISDHVLWEKQEKISSICLLLNLLREVKVKVPSKIFSR